MKNILYTFVLLFLLGACKSTSEETSKVSEKTTQAANTSQSAATKSTKPYSNVDVIAAKALMKVKGKKLIILDVRTPTETAEGMIPRAVEIDFLSKNFTNHIDKLNKSSSYLIYCKAGGRSSKACKLMMDKGFKDVANLVGGYDAWK